MSVTYTKSISLAAVATFIAALCCPAALLLPKSSSAESRSSEPVLFPGSLRGVLYSHTSASLTAAAFRVSDPLWLLKTHPIRPVLSRYIVLQLGPGLCTLILYSCFSRVHAHREQQHYEWKYHFGIEVTVAEPVF